MYNTSNDLLYIYTLAFLTLDPVLYVGYNNQPHRTITKKGTRIDTSMPARTAAASYHVVRNRVKFTP